MALHFILQHLDSSGTYARILLLYFSSAFNTIIPAMLQDKLSQLNVPDPPCRWITEFLSNRKQHVRLGKYVSDSQTISPGSPLGCVLSPLLFSLYTNDWPSGGLVWSEQLGAQRSQDSGDGSRLPEEPSPTCLHHPVWLPSWHCGVLSFPGHHHHPGPQVRAEHQSHHQKGPAEDILPAAAKEVQPAKDNDAALLHRHHWVHPHLLHHLLVRCCHCQGQGQTAVCHWLCWEGDWLQSAISPRPARLQEPEASRWDCGVPSHPGQLFESLPSGRRSSSIRTRTLHTRTASSPQQPASLTRCGTPTDPHRFPPPMDTILHVILTCLTPLIPTPHGHYCVTLTHLFSFL